MFDPDVLYRLSVDRQRELETFARRAEVRPGKAETTTEHRPSRLTRLTARASFGR